MKREICVPEVPASQMVLTIITAEQLEAFADAVITKYQQNIVRRKAAEKPQEEWMTRKEVMTLLRRCDSTMTKWARRGYLVHKATDEDRAMGADIADIIIRWALNRKAEVAPEEPVPPPEQLYADNPVMQEVMRYISPEYWPEVDALIRDLDLELVSVTRIPTK